MNNAAHDVLNTEPVSHDVGVNRAADAHSDISAAKAPALAKAIQVAANAARISRPEGWTSICGHSCRVDVDPVYAPPASQSDLKAYATQGYRCMCTQCTSRVKGGSGEW